MKMGCFSPVFGRFFSLGWSDSFLVFCIFLNILRHKFRVPTRCNLKNFLTYKEALDILDGPCAVAKRFCDRKGAGQKSGLHSWAPLPLVSWSSSWSHFPLLNLKHMWCSLIDSPRAYPGAVFPAPEVTAASDLIEVAAASDLIVVILEYIWEL